MTDTPTRALPIDVEKIIKFDPSIADLRPFILAANELVTELCASVPTYSANRLKIIETWLAAHFLAIHDPNYRLVSESIGAASNSYESRQAGLNLEGTPYGQQAKLLDTNGSLAWIDQHISRGKRAKAGVVWMGTPLPLPGNNWRFYSLYQFFQ